METTTITYKLDEIPKELVVYLHRAQKEISKLLHIESYDDPSIEGFFEELEQFPPLDKLPENISDGIKNFATDILNITVDPKIYKPTITNLRYMFMTRDILREQIDYILDGKEDQTCQIYFIVSLINQIPYGGVFVFYNSAYPDSVVMQGITKFLIPGLFALLYPDESQLLPKLNSILQPHVETLAKSLGANRIYVAPVGRQGSILEKNYDYKKISKFKYPCLIIKGQIGESGNYYVKTIQNEFESL